MYGNPDEPKTIAFVIYQGLTLLDLAGPLGVIQKFCEFNPQYQTSIVAERLETIISDNGLAVIPDRTFVDLPHPFALFIPGGSTPTLKAMTNPAIRRYIQEAAKASTFVGSVCTGALILAANGLLKGKTATTHWAYRSLLESLGSPYQRTRWVENGKIINSAGVSAGVDMALFFISRLADEATAKKVQLWIDYDPQPPYKIDWNRLAFMPRAIRAYHTLAAPFLTSGAKKLLKQGM
jgi:transcriptional regulator GlxA family with amidase domain